MLLNYHIGRLVLSSLCVGALVWLVLSSGRVAGFSLQHGHSMHTEAEYQAKSFKEESPLYKYIL